MSRTKFSSRNPWDSSIVWSISATKDVKHLHRLCQPPSRMTLKDSTKTWTRKSFTHWLFVVWAAQAFMLATRMWNDSMEIFLTRWLHQATRRNSSNVCLSRMRLWIWRKYFVLHFAFEQKFAQSCSCVNAVYHRAMFDFDMHKRNFNWTSVASRATNFNSIERD